MSEPHRIRLRGPWEVEALEAPPDYTITPQIRMQCPCSWRDGGWPNFRGRARHVRQFGKPTNLAADERVWLVIEPCNGQLSVRLNSTRLSDVAFQSAFTTDVTTLLAQRNELHIDVTGLSDQCGLTGEVRLEIRTI